MTACPVCESIKIVVVLTPARQSFCSRCGARWVQDGSEQRKVEAVPSPGPAPSGERPA